MQMFKVWQRVVLHYPNERAADRCGLQISDKEGCCKCHSIRAATYVSSNLYALSILQHMLPNILKLNLPAQRLLIYTLFYRAIEVNKAYFFYRIFVSLVRLVTRYSL